MDKKELLDNRKQFFNDIITSLNRETGELDKHFEQDVYYIKPNKDCLIDVPNGELIVEVNGKFFDIEFKFLYSVWQVGTKLKIGFLLKTTELMEAFARDEQSEILHVWGENKAPLIKAIHGGVFYDWEFDATHLYDSYMSQENYSMGIRHMHLRALKTVYDYASQKNLQYSYEQNGNQEFRKIE